MAKVIRELCIVLEECLPVSWSEVTAAVKPTPEEPRPVVDMAKGAIFIIALKSWDLATEGSPTIIILMSLKEEGRPVLQLL